MFKSLSPILSILIAISPFQGQAGHYKYNAENQMVVIDSHQIKYAPGGSLSQADDMIFSEQVEIQGNIASTRFGGVVMRSDGTYDTTFGDGHNTIKTSKRRSYSSPYGNHKPIGLDIHNNLQVFGGGHSLFGLNYMGARWYFPEFKHFGAQDSYDVSNRFNLDNGNPIMNYDPSGHMSQQVKQGLIFGGMALVALASWGFSGFFTPAVTEGLVALGEVGDIENEVSLNEEILSAHDSFVSAPDSDIEADNISSTSIFKGELETRIPSSLEYLNDSSNMTNHPNAALWSGYMVSNIIPAGITVGQKMYSGASASNIALSAIMPIIAGALGTQGMLAGMAGRNLESAIFGAADNALEGAVYPMMQDKDVKFNSNIFKEMVSGLVSGAFAGAIGAKYGSLGNADVGPWYRNYGRSAGWFALRGPTMEMGRQGVYGLAMTAMDKNYKANFKTIGLQIAVNSPIQAVEGVMMKPFMAGSASKTASFKSIFWNAFGASTGGGVMQFGSPLINSLVS